MKVLFENRFTRTKKLTREIYSYFYFGKPLSLAILILVWLCFAVNAVLFILSLDYFFFGFLIAPVYTLAQLFLFLHQVSLAEKRNKEMNTLEVTVVTKVTDKCIKTVASSGAESSVEYENIVGVARTKNLIILSSSAKLLYIFEKNGFTGGSDKDFLKFLNGKGVKNKLF